ncbi:MAG: helix-turn-helix domain-containing protein [Saprospiraceae bacterium]
MLLQLPDTHFERRQLHTPIENRTVYAMDQAELNVFETCQKAFDVHLTFHAPVLAAMLRGKKVMRLSDSAFDFYPGESVMLPADETMRIDFPEAQAGSPTQCLALSLSQDVIAKTAERLNYCCPRLQEHGEWDWSKGNFHFTNDPAINRVIGRLIWIFTENHPNKAIFADFALQELIMRLMQTEARHVLLKNSAAMQTRSRLASVIQFIRERLSDSIPIAQLSRVACMSEAQLHRTFKIELGATPLDFIQQERIFLAKKLLSHPERSVSDVAYACGFNNVSYFIKVFKRFARCTPASYRRKLRING